MEAVQVEYQKHPPMWVVSSRTQIQQRMQILQIIKKFQNLLPKNLISGSPFCTFYYVTKVAPGNFDVEIGFPINYAMYSSQDEQLNASIVELNARVREVEPLESLSAIHEGSLSSIRDTFGQVFTSAYEKGILSQEFSREVYLDIDERAFDENFEGNPEHKVDLQLIIHNWGELFDKNAKQILDSQMWTSLQNCCGSLELHSSLEEKFTWILKMLSFLKENTSVENQFQIISSCAHIFPDEMVDEMRSVFDQAYRNGATIIEAVDQTLEFMDKTPGFKAPIRKGNILFTSKNPRDPEAFKQAVTRSEKMAAYCYCPFIRNNLDKEIPETFCYCGAGWVRKQWEGTFQVPLKIELMKSLTKGDNECQFAVHIPEKL